MPVFKDKLLGDISVSSIEAFLREIVQTGLSHSRINQIRNVLHAVLGEAVRLGLIEKNPMDSIGRYTLNTLPKGTFDKNMIKMLFDPVSFSIVWKDRHDLHLINLLALTTGMRIGEIQALQVQDIHKDHVVVRHTWDQKYGLKSPKYDSSRLIPVANHVGELVQRFVENQGLEGDQFIFQGTIPGKPLNDKAINASLNQALKAIGISDDDRRLGRITFHSWRHTFNSRMRNRIPDSTLKLLTGHRTDVMLEHYTHTDFEMLMPVIEAANEVFADVRFG